MMRIFLFILLMFSGFSMVGQYTVKRIYFDTDYANNDTLLLKDNTDSLFRLIAGDYIFAGKLKSKSMIISSEIVGWDTKQDALGFTPLAPNGNGSALTGLNKTQVGLPNVDNTSDANKPVSSATQAALDGKQATLVSGTNIKTVNNTSLLGSGNINIVAGGEAFPVGSVFISVVATNPNTLLGYGTWVAFAPGRMLVGFDNTNPNFDAAEETGGSPSVTITASNLPQLSVSITDPGHAHVQNKNTATTGPLSGATPDASTNTSAPSGYSTEPATTGITATANTGGANNSINILNPYITVYMWKRTN